MTLSAEGEGTQGEGTVTTDDELGGTPIEEPDPIGRKRPCPIEEALSTGLTEGKGIETIVSADGLTGGDGLAGENGTAISPDGFIGGACPAGGKGIETTVVSADGLTGGDGFAGGNGRETTVSLDGFTGSACPAGR